MTIVTNATNLKPEVTSAIQRVSQIATLPEITTKIIQVVEDPKSTAKDLKDIIKHDVALCTKILKVVNSAFYGLPRQISSVDRAIVLLGLSTVKNIAIATSMVKLFKGKAISSRFTPRDLWFHSLACGVFCKLISESRGIEGTDEIFVAGLIHDLGLLVEYQVYPDKLSLIIEKAIEEKKSLLKTEEEFLGANHQEFGAALANKWKFPPLFQLATGYHHNPLEATEQYTEVALTIHLADVLAHKKRVGIFIEEIEYIPDIMERLNLSEEQIKQIYATFDEKYRAAESTLK